MKRLERIDDSDEALLVALHGHQATVWTALPGVVVQFDPTLMTAQVQPAMKALLTRPDNTKTWETLPLLVDCPVVFPSGGGFTLTFPIKPGDECLVIFASRCIDSWWEQGCTTGNVPQPAEIRLHDLSDGFVIPGPRSKPRALAVNTTGVELRNDAATAFIRIDDAETILVQTTGNVSVSADGDVYAEAGADAVVTAASITLNGPVTINGTLHVAGNTSITGSLTNNTKNVGSTHTHGGVQTGGGVTGVPT